MKKNLITAFEPFGGETVNASDLTLEKIPDTIGGYEIHKLRVPVVFGLCGDLVIREALKMDPDIIISLGQAEGRARVTPEYVAINFKDARIPDNSGNQPRREPVVPDGSNAYFSTLPVFDMAEAIRDSGIPSDVSYSAGTYVCNELYYTLLHHFKDSDVKVCFIHVPMTPGQATKGQPSIELDQMVNAVIRAIESI